MNTILIVGGVIGLALAAFETFTDEERKDKGYEFMGRAIWYVGFTAFLAYALIHLIVT